MQPLCKALCRRKINTKTEESNLARVLSTLDLTLLGVGSTLGVGVYVLAGEVSKNLAGPAVIFSFMIAAIASIFAGLCYGEFGARVPKAGSAYIYSYVTVGEFVAFIIAWNLILVYIIGSASVSKGLSVYLDAILDNEISNYLREAMPINIPYISSYPDLFSLGVVLLFSIALALGVKESLVTNHTFTIINLCVVLFVIISGLWRVKVSNWFIPKDNVPEGHGEGGFNPYGFNGILKRAATCFYGFIGFDCIATAGEEAKNPQRSMPIAIVVSLVIVFLAYFGISTILTMLLPYFEQNETAPFPYVYCKLGWPVAKYLVTIGALCGLLSSLLGSMFPLPRIIYSMASDGLLCQIFGKIHLTFQTPFIGTIVAGLFTGIAVCFLELSQLFNLMSIGTLCAYSMVAVCVLLLRYESNKRDDLNKIITLKDVFLQICNFKSKSPTRLSKFIVLLAVLIYCLSCFSFVIFLNTYQDLLVVGTVWVLTVVILILIIMFVLTIVISIQPTADEDLAFLVPCVPWVPCFSVLINVYLMTKLDYITWIRFAIWLILGLFTYFGYGIWNSKERNIAKAETSGGSI